MGATIAANCWLPSPFVLRQIFGKQEGLPLNVLSRATSCNVMVGAVLESRHTKDSYRFSMLCGK